MRISVLILGLLLSSVGLNPENTAHASEFHPIPGVDSPVGEDSFEAIEEAKAVSERHRPWVALGLNFGGGAAIAQHVGGYATMRIGALELRAFATDHISINLEYNWFGTVVSHVLEGLDVEGSLGVELRRPIATGWDFVGIPAVQFAYLSNKNGTVIQAGGEGRIGAEYTHVKGRITHGLYARLGLGANIAGSLSGVFGTGGLEYTLAFNFGKRVGSKV